MRNGSTPSSCAAPPPRRREAPPPPPSRLLSTPRAPPLRARRATPPSRSALPIGSTSPRPAPPRAGPRPSLAAPPGPICSRRRGCCPAGRGPRRGEAEEDGPAQRRPPAAGAAAAPPPALAPRRSEPPRARAAARGQRGAAGGRPGGGVAPGGGRSAAQRRAAAARSRPRGEAALSGRAGSRRPREMCPEEDGGCGGGGGAAGTGGTDAAAAAALDELRSWWEVPAIAHFCSLFRTAFRLPDFEIEVRPRGPGGGGAGRSAPNSPRKLSSAPLPPTVPHCSGSAAAHKGGGGGGAGPPWGPRDQNGGGEGRASTPGVPGPGPLLGRWDPTWADPARVHGGIVPAPPPGARCPPQLSRGFLLLLFNKRYPNSYFRAASRGSVRVSCFGYKCCGRSASRWEMPRQDPFVPPGAAPCRHRAVTRGCGAAAALEREFRRCSEVPRDARSPEKPKLLGRGADL